MGIEAAIIGGTIASAAIGAGSQMATNSANKEMADSVNRQNQRNADTAHQREVADLRRAGLNPILSATGAGAPIPQMQVPEFQNPGTSVADAFSKGITNYSAMENLRQLEPAIQKVNSEAKLNEALTVKAVADTSTAQSVQKLNDVRSLQTLASTDLTKAQITQLTKSPFLSKFIGTEDASSLTNFGKDAFRSMTRSANNAGAATHHAFRNLGNNLGNFASSANDKISDKLNSILDDVYKNSAKLIHRYNQR